MIDLKFGLGNYQAVSSNPSGDYLTKEEADVLYASNENITLLEEKTNQLATDVSLKANSDEVLSKVEGTVDNISILSGDGNLKDSGKSLNDFASLEKIEGYLNIGKIGSFNDVPARLSQEDVINANSTLINFIVSNDTYGDENGLCLSISTQGKVHQTLYWKDQVLKRTLEVVEGIVTNPEDVFYVQAEDLEKVYLPNRIVNSQTLFNLTTEATSEEIQACLKFESGDRLYPVVTESDLDSCLLKGTPILDNVMNTPVYVGWDGDNYTLFCLRQVAPNKPIGIYQIGLHVEGDVYSITNNGTKGAIITSKDLESYVKTEDLTEYATKTDLDNYATVESLESKANVEDTVKKVVGVQNNFVSFGEEGAILDSGNKAADFALKTDLDAKVDKTTAESTYATKTEVKALPIKSTETDINIGATEKVLKLLSKDVATLNDEVIATLKDIYGDIDFSKYKDELGVAFEFACIDQSFIDELGTPDNVDGTPYTGISDGPAAGKIKLNDTYFIVLWFDSSFTSHWDAYSVVSFQESNLFKALNTSFSAVYTSKAEKSELLSLFNIPIRDLKDQIYDFKTIMSWFGLYSKEDYNTDDLIKLKKVILKGNWAIKYGISLSTNPMYYFLPIQYMALESATKLVIKFDGLDTKNDISSRYEITINLDGTIVSGNSNIECKVTAKQGVKVNPATPAAAETVTKAEFDAVVTQFNLLLTSLKDAGIIAK